MKLALCLIATATALVAHSWTCEEVHQLIGRCNKENQPTFQWADPNFPGCAEAASWACATGKSHLTSSKATKAQADKFIADKCPSDLVAPDSRRLDEDTLDQDQYFKMLIDRADASKDDSLDLEESLSAKGHGHNPHGHNPHGHSPHGHNPHVHTPYPTPSPTNYPTPSPTNYPTPSPTNYPTPSPTNYPTPSPTNYPTSS